MWFIVNTNCFLESETLDHKHKLVFLFSTIQNDFVTIAKMVNLGHIE